MVIWSILTEQAWNDLQRRGRLRASRRHVTKDFLGPYTWMAEQMERRLTVARPSGDTMPIWAWYQWEGKRCRPDLRTSGHLPKGTKGFRVECRVEDERVLLSDFDLWHYVLNYWYLPASEQDGVAFEEKLAGAGLSFYKCGYDNPLPHAEYRRKIEKSWERMFDLDWTDKDDFIADPRERKSIQATLWEIRLADVVDAREFTAR